MLAKALKRGLELLDNVPLGKRFDAGQAQLGLLQRWYAAQTTSRVIGAVIELEQAVSEPQLEAAIRKLCARHPYALGVCQRRSTAQLDMQPLAADAAPALFIAPRSDMDAWSLAERLLHESFPVGTALFRVAAADRGKRLVCSFDHLMFDGISAGQFACELARTLGGAPLAAAADTEEPLPLDARVDLRPSAAQLMQALREAAPPVPPLPNPPSSPRNLSTRVARHQIASTDTEQLRAQARREGVTLHAAISSCALLAAAEVLDARSGSLRLHTPISLRAQCRPEPRGFGVFIGSVDVDLQVAPHSDLWPVAREYAEALARDKPNAPGKVGLLAFAGDLRQRAQRLDSENYGRTATVEVSNVGRVLDVPPGTNVWLTQGAHYRGPLFVLTLLESAGVVRACLSTPYPLIDDNHTSGFMRAFAAQLAKARSR